MAKTVGVCIAAMNEERTIRTVIEAVLSSSLLRRFPETQIRVCVNGSTDRTIEIVRELSAQDSRVCLFSREQPSKGAAWNALVASSEDEETLVFLDADIDFDDQMLEEMVNELDADDSLVILGALPIAAEAGETKYSWLQAILASFINCPEFVRRRVELYGVCGMAYAIRGNQARATRVPTERGIVEDAALSCMFYGKARKSKKVFVRHVAPNFFDLVGQGARARRSRNLVQAKHPELHQLQLVRNQRFRSTRVASVRQVPLKHLPAVCIWFASQCLAKLLCIYYDHTGANSWPVPESTKQPITKVKA